MSLSARDVTISVLQKMEKVEEMIIEKNLGEDTSSRNNDFFGKVFKVFKECCYFRSSPCRFRPLML